MESLLGGTVKGRVAPIAYLRAPVLCPFLAPGAHRPTVLFWLLSWVGGACAFKDIQIGSCLFSDITVNELSFASQAGRVLSSLYSASLQQLPVLTAIVRRRDILIGSCSENLCTHRDGDRLLC